MRPIAPHMLVDGDQEAMDFARYPGTYDSTLVEANQYIEGDLVTINASGKVQKANAATAALLKAAQLYFAGQSWDQPFAKPYLLAKGVPLNVIPRRNRFVMTYQGNAADGADYTFTSADLLAVQQGASRELGYNATEGFLTVRNGTTNVKCVLKGVFKGEVGDTNVRVLVELIAEAA